MELRSRKLFVGSHKEISCFKWADSENSNKKYFICLRIRMMERQCTVAIRQEIGRLGFESTVRHEVHLGGFGLIFQHNLLCRVALRIKREERGCRPEFPEGRKISPPWKKSRDNSVIQMWHKKRHQEMDLLAPCNEVWNDFAVEINTGMWHPIFTILFRRFSLWCAL